MTDINLNDRVTVTLTEHGHAVVMGTYGREAQGLGLTDQEVPGLEDDGSWSTMLWELMRVLGPHMGMGMQDLVRGCKITIE